MSRYESTHYDLTEIEKRDFIKLVETGKPLPERYHFLLFEDKRQVELVWNGKSRDVCTAVLPFQTLEHIDEPRKEANAEIEPDRYTVAVKVIDIFGNNTMALVPVNVG